MQLYAVAPLIYQVLSLSSESFHNGWCLQKRDLVNDLKILLETTILLIIHLDNLFGINMGKTSQRKRSKLHKGNSLPCSERTDTIYACEFSWLMVIIVVLF